MWKPFVHNPRYEISDTGIVRNRRTKRVLSQWLSKRGKKTVREVYRFAPWGSRTYDTHVAMLETYVGPRPIGQIADFVDGDPKNLKLSNLRWLDWTPPCGKKLSFTAVEYIRRLRKAGVPADYLAHIYHVHKRHINAIARGDRWKRTP